jgi:hypothetical protein
MVVGEVELVGGVDGVVVVGVGYVVVDIHLVPKSGERATRRVR